MTTNEVEHAVIIDRLQAISDITDEPDEFLLPINGYEQLPLVLLETAVEELVDILPTIKTYTHMAKEKCQQPIDGLSQDESAAIMLYTMGWQPHEQCLYFTLNSTLRTAIRQKLKPWLLYLKLLLHGLTRLPKISATVYRYVRTDLRQQYLMGKTIIWWAFSTCTKALNSLQTEDHLGQIGSRTLFIIDCETGRDISQHTFFSSSNEILLMAATQFQVIDCLDQGDLFIVRMKETQPIYPLLQPVIQLLPPISRSNDLFDPSILYKILKTNQISCIFFKL